MKKIVSAMMLSLMALPALAEDAIHAAPKVDADPTALIICAVLMVAMFGGFFGYMVWKDRREQEAKAQE